MVLTKLNYQKIGLDDVVLIEIIYPKYWLDDRKLRSTNQTIIITYNIIDLFFFLSSQYRLKNIFNVEI